MQKYPQNIGNAHWHTYGVSSPFKGTQWSVTVEKIGKMTGVPQNIR